MTRASMAGGWSAWTTAYRPTTATITIATKATACTRSLSLRATLRHPSDEDPHRTDDDNLPHSRTAEQDADRAPESLFVEACVDDSMDVVVIARCPAAVDG